LLVICEFGMMIAMTRKPDTKKPNPPLLQVKMTSELIAKLDDLRLGRGDFPTRSDIVRELIEKAHSTRKRS
jgi:ribbon-helix-helix CopG family protein